ncbi:MAG: CBS domain-containing protein [Desulfobacterales bacterium]|nr:CBS domain-containing protein [Desulfobacterales bacterium]
MYDAVIGLEKAQEKYTYKHSAYRHRAILVLDQNGKVIGKISQIDVLRALEPKYEEILEGRGFMASVSPRNSSRPCSRTMPFSTTRCATCAARLRRSRLRNSCTPPARGNSSPRTATLDQAIHQFVIGNHQSLLVTRGEDIIGILRLTDVFTAVFHMMKECRLD